MLGLLIIVIIAALVCSAIWLMPWDALRHEREETKRLAARVMGSWNGQTLWRDLPSGGVAEASATRADAQEEADTAVRGGDHGVFFIRPFRETGSLAAQTTETSLGTWTMGATWHPRHIDLEELFKKAFKNRPFKALGHPTERSVSFGATRIYLSDDAWWSHFEEFASQSSVILVLPDASANVVREILWLQQNQFLQKCVFIMLETIPSEGNREPGWQKAVESLKQAGLTLPPYDKRGALIRLDQCGGLAQMAPLNLSRTLFRTDRLQKQLAAIGVDLNG